MAFEILQNNVQILDSTPNKYFNINETELIQLLTKAYWDILETRNEEVGQIINWT